MSKAKAKAKVAKKQTYFVAIGRDGWGDSQYVMGWGSTKKEAIQDLRDNDGGPAEQYLEVILPSFETFVSKVPTAKVEIK